MKPCPFCAEEIQDEAIKCKHCGSMLADVSLPPPYVDPGAHVPPSSRLARTSRSKILAGVCGGFGRYFGIDPVWLRIAYAVIAVLTGFVPGVILYIILALVLPRDDAPVY